MYKLIIVDDEEIIRDGLREYIDWGSIGFEVIGTFEDGADVIKFLNETPVDAIFTDIQMYQVSGIELAKYVMENFPKIKVVALSNYRDFDYVKQSMSFNVCDYILKPIDMEEVLTTFRKVYELLQNDHQHQKNVPVFSSDTLADVTQKSLIEKIDAYIRSHIDQKLTLEEIAQNVYLNPSYLSREFKQITGINLSSYILDLKMQTVFTLMKNNPFASVEELAYKIGYYDVRYFHRVFKQYTGHSVKEYQQLLHHSKKDF